MSISIMGATPSAASATPASPNRSPAEREAMRDLTRALKADDLGDARRAYVSIIKNAPEGATFPRGSQFAALGRALVGCDMAAAQEAFKSMVRGRIDGGPAGPPLVPLPPQPGAGLADGLVDLIA